MARWMGRVCLGARPEGAWPSCCRRRTMRRPEDRLMHCGIYCSLPLHEGRAETRATYTGQHRACVERARVRCSDEFWGFVWTRHQRRARGHQCGPHIQARVSCVGRSARQALALRYGIDIYVVTSVVDRQSCSLQARLAGWEKTRRGARLAAGLNKSKCLPKNPRNSYTYRSNSSLRRFACCARPARQIECGRKTGHTCR